MKETELKDLAKEKGFRGYSRLRKAELIDLLKAFLLPETKPKVGGQVQEYQSRKKQTRREKRDKKNFVHSFEEEPSPADKERRLKRLKKVWPPSTKN